MANRINADTSVLINLQKGDKKTITHFAKYHRRIVISRITACELIYGSRDNKEKKVNKEFLENFEIIEINEAISSFTFFILDKYGLATKLGIIDAVIAATSVIYKYPLWTPNKKHFSQIKELTLL